MAERHRSKDGTRETDAFISDLDAPSQQGREGGTLARKVGTRDEAKRAEEPDAGITRVRKSDHPDDADTGKG